MGLYSDFHAERRNAIQKWRRRQQREPKGKLECPQCGQPEIKRIKQGNVQHVLFGCMLMVTLPTDKNDVQLQHQLDEWKRTGGLEEWLKKPMFSKGTTVVVIKDKEILNLAKEHFDELWKKGKEVKPKETRKHES